MALRAAFAGLPSRCQQLLSMLTSDPPHSYAEISAELGIPVGSIGPYRARCLDRLRRHPVIADDAVGVVSGPGQDQPVPGPSAGTEPAWTDPARLDTAGAHRGPTPLTPREHEIVRLIARGLSNREIADELVISPATAARHVATILAKLGFKARVRELPHGRPATIRPADLVDLPQARAGQRRRRGCGAGGKAAPSPKLRGLRRHARVSAVRGPGMRTALGGQPRGHQPTKGCLVLPLRA